MEIGIEDARMLAQHPLAKDENLVAHFLVTFTGFPRNDNTKEKCMQTLAKSLIEARREFSAEIGTLHVAVEEFNPQVFFGVG